MTDEALRARGYDPLKGVAMTGGTIFWHWVYSLKRHGWFNRDPRYLAELEIAAKAALITIPADTAYFRGRVNSPPVDPIEPGGGPWPGSDMMAPRWEITRANRLNPPGVRCLYMASNQETVVAELRPWRNEQITVAEFRATADLRVVDFSGRRGVLDMSQVRGINGALPGWVGAAMARPIHSGDPGPYTATQFIAEFVKALHPGPVHGVLYPSGLSADGHNLAVFSRPSLTPDPVDSAFRCVGTHSRRVARITYESVEDR